MAGREALVSACQVLWWRRGPGPYKFPYAYGAMGSDYVILTAEGGDAGIDCVFRQVESEAAALSMVMDGGGDDNCLVAARTTLQIMGDMHTSVDKQLGMGALPASPALCTPHFSQPLARPPSGPRAWPGAPLAA